jgi:hypothetical protein
MRETPSRTGTGDALMWRVVGRVLATLALVLIVAVLVGVGMMQVDSVVHIIDRLEQARHGAYLSTNIGER